MFKHQTYTIDSSSSNQTPNMTKYSRPEVTPSKHPIYSGRSSSEVRRYKNAKFLNPKFDGKTVDSSKDYFSSRK